MANTEHTAQCTLQCMVSDGMALPEAVRQASQHHSLEPHETEDLKYGHAQINRSLGLGGHPNNYCDCVCQLCCQPAGDNGPCGTCVNCEQPCCLHDDSRNPCCPEA